MDMVKKENECKIIDRNGYPVFSFRGEELAPVMFRSFRPTPANISLFARAGVRISQIMVSGQMNGMDIPYSLYGPVWVDEHSYDFDAFERQLQAFTTFAPDSYYLIFIQLDTPAQWLLRHPESVSSFSNLQAGCQDEEWKAAAAEYLKTFIEYCETKHGSKICGYMISAGRSCEWFSGTDLKHPLIREAYLGKAQTKAGKVPVLSSYETGKSILRKKNSKEMDFLRFCENNTADIALYFSAEAQKVLNHKKPLGLFGGYFALRNNALLTNLFEKVWESADVDMICSPAMYDDFRKLSNASAMTIPIDSLKMAGKLHINELDHRTELAYYPCEYPVLPPKKRMGYRLLPGNLMDDCYKTHFESEMVLRRELASCLQKSSAFWWFDFYGGYYGDDRYERMLRQHVDIYKRITSARTGRKNLSGTAVIVQTPAMSYIRDGGGLQKALVYDNIREIAKSGALYDVYNLADLRNIDLTGYRCVIFLNVLDPDEETESYIRENMNCAYKIWIYAAGLVGKSVARMSELIGMKIREVHPIPKAPDMFKEQEKLKVQEEETAEDTVGMISEWEGFQLGFERKITPSFYVEDPEASELTRYRENGLVSAAAKGKNFYFAYGSLPAALWRHLFHLAGVHLYSQVNGALYANSHFISYQTSETENVALNVGRNGVVEELFDGGRYEITDGLLSYETPKGTTKLFVWITEEDKRKANKKRN